MTILNYINQKKELYKLLLDFIENEDNTEGNFHNLINIMKEQNIIQSREELQAFFYLISKLSNNHCRNNNFCNKIQQIIIKIEGELKHQFSNFEIFKITRNNIQILLFLLNKKIISIDDTIINQISKNNDQNGIEYFHFFYPELKTFINETMKKKYESELLKLDEKIFSHFEEKRSKGENDSPICELIRKDAVKEFSDYVTQNHIPLSSKIKHSIFETNSFLLKNKETTLIEYAAFYGSIQIFQNLRLNGIELDPSLWLYAVHGNNLKLIHLLEESKVETEGNNFELVLKEAIKCHHNEVANYIQKHYMHHNQDCIAKFSFQYYDYLNFPSEFNDKSIFYHLCQFNHLTLVKLFLKEKGSLLSKTKIYKKK